MEKLLVRKWLELNRNLLWKVVASGLEAVLVSQEGDCVDLAVWGGPRDGSADDEVFFWGSGVLHFGGLASGHSVAGFITENNFFINAHPYSSHCLSLLRETVSSDSDVIAFVFQDLGIL